MLENCEMRTVYVDKLKEFIEKDDKVVVLEADLSSSISTDKLETKLGEKYINVGIMEAEMVGVAAGLSVTGFKPFMHTFSSFAGRRAFDQIFLSINYSKQKGVLLGSDAGISAATNGGTHMGLEDIALMRTIPYSNVYEPSDSYTFKYIMEEAYKKNGFSYIRTIRKPAVKIRDSYEDFTKGYSVLKNGNDAVVIASGIMVSRALKAAKLLEEKGIDVKVIDLFRIKPLNHEIIEEFKNIDVVVTAENHNIIGGVGSAIAELTSEVHPKKISRIGVREKFGEVGSMEYLSQIFGLTDEDIYNTITKRIGRE